MAVELSVPTDAPSVEAALEVARQRGSPEVGDAEEGHSEPAQAWPLELQASASGPDTLRRIEVLGPPGRAASVRDVGLDAHGSAEPGGEEVRVVLRGVVVRGCAVLGGRGCELEDCEVRCGVEVGNEGAGVVRGCSIRARRVGVSVRGPVVLEGNEVDGCDVGVGIYGNPAAELRGNTLRGCRAAAVMLHCSLGSQEGCTLQLAPVLASSNALEGCGRQVEVCVEVEGAVPLSFEQWPLPPGPRTARRLRGGGCVEVEVVDEQTLQVVGAEGPGEGAGGQQRAPRKRRRAVTERAEAAEAGGPLATGPAWALEALGISADGATAGQLRAAYRRRARQVHPDKQGAESTAQVFHEVTAAYEAAQRALAAEAPAEPGPAGAGRRG
ncbi:unnamed protein product, partial [Prorocentrum cordatum]